jgi:hypothetical protein
VSTTPIGSADTKQRPVDDTFPTFSTYTLKRTEMNHLQEQMSRQLMEERLLERERMRQVRLALHGRRTMRNAQSVSMRVRRALINALT